MASTREARQTPVMQSPSYRFATLTSTAGDEVTFAPSGLTCIVGGNNVGKSQLLRELFNSASETPDSHRHVVLRSVTATRGLINSEADAEAWLSDFAFQRTVDSGQKPRFAGDPDSWGITALTLQQYFSTENDSPLIHDAAQIMIRLTRAGRLADYATGEMQRGRADLNSWGIEKVYSNGPVGKKIEELTLEAFGVRVVLDRANVPTRFRTGDPGVDTPPLDNPSVEYRRALQELPSLDDQGDGLRSFVGLATLLLAVRPCVALIDEPEAFLHPGQARACGRWLAGVAGELNTQVIVATHDRDLLVGMMSHSAGTVDVVRLARDERGARFHHLSAHEISGLWDDPMLRYSNALQGLFHRRAVICEPDGDCRFFAATLENSAADSAQRALADDTLFIPAGGKGRVAKVARSVAQLGVPTVAILDFDALKTKAVIRDVVESLGHDWNDDLEGLYRVVADAANAKQGLWEAAKNTGMQSFPAGPAFEALAKLIASLTELGLVILPFGEMEDLDKSINLHGSAWVAEALSGETYKTPQAQAVVAPLLLPIE